MLLLQNRNRHFNVRGITLALASSIFTKICEQFEQKAGGTDSLFRILQPTNHRTQFLCKKSVVLGR